MSSVEKLIEETGLGSVSWFGEELMSALSSEDVDALEGDDDDEDEDLDDISSLSFSDISHLTAAQPAGAHLAGQLLETGGDDIRREMKRQASIFNERDEEARHQRALLERRLLHAQQRHANEISSLVARHQAEHRSLSKSFQEAKIEISSLKERLTANKTEMLAGLPVSEARLRELQQLPEDSLGLKEIVQLHTGELLLQAAQTRDAHRREIDALKETLLGTRRELAEQQARSEEAHASSSAREIEHGKRVAELQGTSLQLLRDNEDLKNKLKVYEERSTRCEQAESKLTAASEHIAGLQKELEAAREDLRTVKLEKTASSLQAEERLQQVELLQMDKQFLSKEVEGLREANARLEERAEKQSAKAKEAKRAKEHMQTQMANQQALASVHVEDRLQTELAALRQRAEEEIREVKRTTQELYARQLDAAQQAKDEAQAELQRLRARADQLQMERDQAMREHMQLTASVDETLGEVRGQLRMKEFEFERLAVSHEDAQNLLRQLRLENDMYRGKLDVLKAEFYKLQTDTTARITELEHGNEQARAKLSAYHSIETHLNVAVEGIDAFSEASGEDAQRQIISLGSGLPTDPQRRLVQVMSLASKVVEQQKKIQQLNKRCAVCGALCVILCVCVCAVSLSVLVFGKGYRRRMYVCMYVYIFFLCRV
jgi:hypothetical protein